VVALKPCWLLRALEEKVPLAARLASDSGWTKIPNPPRTTVLLLAL
jgi:hypothetical protein